MSTNRITHYFQNPTKRPPAYDPGKFAPMPGNMPGGMLNIYRIAVEQALRDVQIDWLFHFEDPQPPKPE